MLQKYPRRSSAGPIIKAFLVAEVAAFGVAYYVYHKMNTSRDYRRWMYDKSYTILDGFYRLGEAFGDDVTRKNDFRIWGIEDKKK